MVEDSSWVAGKRKVGDKLMAVDANNLEAMSAIDISKMINSKSVNPKRKLTVIRSFPEWKMGLLHEKGG